MVQTVRLTMDISQLLITVADVPVARSRSSRVHTWRRQSSSHGCTRCGLRRVGQLIIELRADGVSFRALHTGAGPGVVSTGTWPP